MRDKAPPFQAPGGRLKEGLRPELTAVAYPVPDERIAPVLEAVHRFDKAHVIMLAEAGILSGADAASLLRVLTELEQDPEGLVVARLRIGGGNHSGEKHMIAQLGETVAGRIHAGRSSGDITATANRITQQRALARSMGLALDLRRALRDMAHRDRDALLMGYSHLQHALPTTFGHYWLSCLTVLERDYGRMIDVYRRFDFCPAGAAVLTGSRFPLRPQRTAELLGFSRPFTNSRDATWSVDSYLEAFSALALLLNDCARIAEDLLVWSSEEFGFIELADGFCITSSILPQKKNPIALEHVRGVASVALGRLASALAGFRATTDSIVIDRYLFTGELWRTFDDAAGALKLLTAVLRDVTIHYERAVQVFAGSWFWASDLAAALVLECNLAWRTAQQSVSRLVRRVKDAGRAPESVTEADVEQAVHDYAKVELRLAPGFVDAVRNPGSIVRSRIVPGGPAPADLDAQLEGVNKRISSDAQLLLGIDRQHISADEELENAVSERMRG